MHVDKFMLAVQTMNVQHEDVVCQLFPLTFEGKASTWYFLLVQGSMTNWAEFNKAFLDKFGEDKTPALLALELSQIKMELKERIKDFNKRFITLKNKILVASQPPEDIIIENYTSALPKYPGMFVKRAGKTTLVETFEEAIKVEKDSMSYEPDRSGKSDTFPRRKIEKPNSEKIRHSM